MHQQELVNNFYEVHKNNKFSVIAHKSHRRTHQKNRSFGSAMAQHQCHYSITSLSPSEPRHVPVDVVHIISIPPGTWDQVIIPPRGGRINKKSHIGLNINLFYYMIFYINNSYNVLIQGGNV